MMDATDAWDDHRRRGEALQLINCSRRKFLAVAGSVDTQTAKDSQLGLEFTKRFFSRLKTMMTTTTVSFRSFDDLPSTFIVNSELFFATTKNLF
jgi:hypothetical protein